MAGSPRYQPPEPDELEVSVFGPGRGECIVVKPPNAPWLIVDSFLVGTPGAYVPVSVEYLKRLGTSDVFGFLITHWHQDHTRGAAAVVREFGQTLKYVALPHAINSRELASLLVDLLPDRRRFSIISDLADVMTELKRPQLSHVQRMLLSDGIHLPTTTGSTLRSLSPSFDDIRHQAATMLSYLPEWNGPRPKNYDVNSGCAVLQLICKPFSVLLYSDLDIGDSDTRGLRCIVKKYNSQLRADIIKVGHHGSETAYHPPALVAGQASLAAGAITPFPSRGEPLPRRKHVEKYKAALGRLHISAPHGPPLKRAGKVSLDVTPFVGYVKSIAGHLDGIGQVRYRIRPGDQKPRIELFARAYAA